MKMYCSSELRDQPVRVIKLDKKVDLLLLEGPAAVALKIAKTEPEFGADVMMAGWPVGWQQARPLPFFGRMALQDLNIGFSDNTGDEWPAHPMNFYHEGGGPGMSGCPIFNTSHEVIGVVEVVGQFPSISVGSPTVKVIRKFLEMK